MKAAALALAALTAAATRAERSVASAAQPTPRAADSGRAAPPVAVRQGVAAAGRDPTEAWVQANAAFRAGRYGDAVAAYEGLLAEGFDDGELYYNLGNAYLRRGELPRAIAAFRAAQARLPRNEDVDANLRFARAQVQDAVAPPEPSSALRALFFWHYGLSPRELVTTGLAVYVLFWPVLAAAVVSRRRPWRYPAAVLGLALAALVPSVALRIAAPTTVAVVNRPELPVYSGLGATNVVRFRLHAGAEALVMGSDEGWVRIRLADGMQGWVPSDTVLLVTL
jgi:tetratricopeptide (TPR) repeat protein